MPTAVFEFEMSGLILLVRDRATRTAQALLLKGGGVTPVHVPRLAVRLGSLVPGTPRRLPGTIEIVAAPQASGRGTGLTCLYPVSGCQLQIADPPSDDRGVRFREDPGFDQSKLPKASTKAWDWRYLPDNDLLFSGEVEQKHLGDRLDKGAVPHFSGGVAARLIIDRGTISSGRPKNPGLRDPWALTGRGKAPLQHYFSDRIIWRINIKEEGDTIPLRLSLINADPKRGAELDLRSEGEGPNRVSLGLTCLPLWDGARVSGNVLDDGKAYARLLRQPSAAYRATYAGVDRGNVGSPKCMVRRAVAKPPQN